MWSMLGHRTGGVRRPVTAVALAVFVAFASSCIVLVQDETFAVGTESHRVNLVVYVDPTSGLDWVRQELGTAAARDVVLAELPGSLNLPAAVRTVLCAANAALCLTGAYVPNLVLSWLRSDVRDRSDFGPDLAAAAAQDNCFAWTVVPGRNFTTKPIGNSGCRQNDD